MKELNTKSFSRSQKNKNVSYFNPNNIFPKLTINQPNDKYEQEANAMADKVMGMPENKLQKQEVESEETIQAKADIQRQEKPEEEEPLQAMTEIQRQVTPEEEEEPIQTKAEVHRQEKDKEEEPIKTKPNRGDLQVSPSMENQLLSSKGGGSPLPSGTNRYMSNAFGADFSHVRIHTDSHAAQMNKNLNAQAFTYGNDIYFNDGKYNPEGRSGQQLLAHELMHTIQQGSSVSQHVKDKKIQRLFIKTEGEPPHGWANVPRNEVKRIKEAVKIVERVLKLKESIRYFEKHCPGGTKETSRIAFENCELWKNPDNNTKLYGQGEMPGSHISYTQTAYNMGVWTLAGTIVHELMHNCGASDENECENALTPSGRLPKIPVGQRDKGGIEPVHPGPAFFISEVRRMSGNPKKQFITMVSNTDEPVGCNGEEVFIDENHSYWKIAYTAQVRELAELVVKKCRKPSTIKRKLTIGTVDDPLEREADNMAERVMTLPENVAPVASSGDNEGTKILQEQTFLHKKANETEEKEPIQTLSHVQQQGEEPKELIQTKAEIQRQESDVVLFHYLILKRTKLL